MTTHTPMRVPEHFSRVDIGAYMRELRLHYSLSEHDVSERLHIRVKYIIAMEQAQFEVMPGTAYAKGYVHTYAEFLGLDANQVVERCFGGELAREVQAHSLPESSDWYKRNRRFGGLLAVLLVLGGLAYCALSEDDSVQTAAEVAEIGSVPEEYLAGLRNRLMPTADTYDCLMGSHGLACFQQQRVTRLVAPQPVPDMSPAGTDAPSPLDDTEDSADEDSAETPVDAPDDAGENE